LQLLLEKIKSLANNSYNCLEELNSQWYCLAFY
jgi:hypothetical protein